MDNRMIVRTISNLSFSGEKCAHAGQHTPNGILLKTSPKSDIKIWIPAQEVKCIILPSGEEIQGKDFKQWSS